VPVAEVLMAEDFPVLWICGPSGVGKSTVAWQLFTELAQAGTRVSFVDTDQLGMCHPAPPGEHGRLLIKDQNLAALIPGYQAAGAQCLIVNGVADPLTGPAIALPAVTIMTCRLRADAEEIVRRFAARSGEDSDLREVRDEIAALEQSEFADACVDTTGIPVAQVVEQVRKQCASWPGFTGRQPELSIAAEGYPADPGEDAAGQIMLICGPPGVGKSTIGFSFYLRCLQSGLSAGYLDLDQLGFLRPLTDDDARRLKARNLAAIWRNFRAAGATHLIATGPIHDASAAMSYAAELSGATVTLCRLRASPDELRQRILSRGAGGSWPQPGDPLRDQPASVLLAVAARAAEQAAALDGADGADRAGRAGREDLTIDTDGLSPSESADLIGAAAGWLAAQPIIPGIAVRPSGG
jgi:adenylylsulfate kinase-like enzyme